MDIKQNNVLLQILNKKQFLLEKKGRDSLLARLKEEESLINEGIEFRARIFTPLQTIYTFIKQVLSPDKSCKNAVAGIIAERAFEDKAQISTSTGSYSKARERLLEGTIT